MHEIELLVHFEATFLFSPPCNLAYTRLGDSDGPLEAISSAVGHLETSRCLKNGQN